MKQIKQTWAKMFVILLAVWLIGYAWWLLSRGAIIGTSDIFNYAGYALVLVIAGYMIAMVLRPTVAPAKKRHLSLMGLVVIFFAQAMLVDQPTQMIYLADIMKLVGVLLIVGWPAWLFHDDQVVQERKIAEAEIIEV
jgi:peptidoglycan/LPS O-acetylase OafA/YrhL